MRAANILSICKVMSLSVNPQNDQIPASEVVEQPPAH